METRRLRSLCAAALLVVLAGGALGLPLLHAAGHATAHAHAEAISGPAFEAPPCALCEAPLGREALLPTPASAEATLPLSPAAEPADAAPHVPRAAGHLGARAPPARA